MPFIVALAGPPDCSLTVAVRCGTDMEGLGLGALPHGRGSFRRRSRTRPCRRRGAPMPRPAPGGMRSPRAMRESPGRARDGRHLRERRAQQHQRRGVSRGLHEQVEVQAVEQRRALPPPASARRPPAAAGSPPRDRPPPAPSRPPRIAARAARPRAPWRARWPPVPAGTSRRCASSSRRERAASTRAARNSTCTAPPSARTKPAPAWVTAISVAVGGRKRSVARVNPRSKIASSRLSPSEARSRWTWLGTVTAAKVHSTSRRSTGAANS